MIKLIPPIAFAWVIMVKLLQKVVSAGEMLEIVIYYFLVHFRIWRIFIIDNCRCDNSLESPVA